MIGKPYSGKLNVRFDEGELETGYGCDIVTLTDERVRNCEHKLQPVATAPALYSTQSSFGNLPFKSKLEVETNASD